MPRPGGPANKYGNRYEDRWTAHCALRVLSGQASSIHLEGPNAEAGFEFSLVTPAGTEYHQVKRQKTAEGRWTLAALDEAKVLSAFYEKLQDPNAICVFASGHSAHVLEELCDWAGKAKSWKEFESQLESRLTWKGHFEELRDIWGSDGEWIWEALIRVRVATIGELELRSTIALQAELYLSGPTGADATVAVLVDVLRDKVDERLVAEDLWRALKAHGYAPNKLAEGPGARGEVAAANKRFRTSRHATLINEELIRRPEAAQLREALAEQRVVFLHGIAGMGKSDVLLEFCEGLEKAGTQYLAMRLDRQDVARNAEELGQGLGLSSSPAAVLAGAAPNELAFLVIDQLDALSATSGRNPRFFEAVAETVALALADPRIRVVLSCRTFDAENDSRLRRLASPEGEEKPAEVEVGSLPAETVSAVLGGLGIDATALDAEVLSLLRRPVHLSLLDGIAAAGRLEAEGLHNLLDLYDAYWSAKSGEVQEAVGGESHWTEVLETLVDYMSEHQALVAPAALLDRWPAESAAMISAGLLVEDRGQLAFFHETFFDYVFARRFIGRDRTLEELLRADQFLFRRAQVRQVLEYSRRAARDFYLESLNFLLHADWVRFHLKDLVLAWLGAISGSGADEWKILAPILDHQEHPLNGRAWSAVCSPAWFDFLDGDGRLEAWLANEDRRDYALASLAASVDLKPRRVAALLARYANASADWRRRIAGVLSRSELSSGRELVDLQLGLIADGTAANGEFWFSAHDLSETHPEWACELLGAYLRNRLDAAIAKGVANPFERGAEIMPPNLHLNELIAGAAKGAPDAFAEWVWPVIVEMIERAAEPSADGERLKTDRIWLLRHFGDVYGDFEDHLLVGTEKALAELARTNPGRFEELIAEQASAEIESLISFLYRGFAGNPAHFADMAIDYLLADSRRFRVGYSDGDHWGTRKMLEAVTPEASEQSIDRLVTATLDYYTPWERSKQGYRQRGMSQFALLGGVAEQRRPAAARKRFAELQRKFDLDDAPAPFGIQGGFVGSPIDPKNAERMSDENWLVAMRTYADDDFEHRRDFLKGGARQLSSVLEEEAERDPIRFAGLAEQMDDEVNLAYFEALLRGVGKSETEVPLAVAARLVERCDALPDRPCGQWIAHPLRRFAEEGIPQQLLEILGWYGINGDPESSVSVSDNPDKRERQMRGLNSVRGGMAYEIARLVAANATNIGPLEPAIRSLVRDQNVGVREAAVEIPLAVLRHNEALALELFTEAIRDVDDVVLASNGVHEFLRYRAIRHFETLKPVIERMLASEDREVRSSGAAQAALAALELPEATELYDECLADGPELRLGVARVLSANLASARFQALCEKGLAQLFDDEDVEIRKEASKAIRHLRGGGLDAVQDLARRFLSSRAFAEDPEAIMFAIEGAECPPVEFSLEATEAVLGALSAPNDIRTRDAMIAAEVNGVLMQIYTDARDPETKNKALDLFDAAVEANSYGAHRELDKYDRG